MIVYAVSYGSYSDWGISNIFSSKEKAQEYIDFYKAINEYNDINDNIIEYEVDKWSKIDTFWVKIKKNYDKELKITIHEEPPKYYIEGTDSYGSMYVKVHFTTNPEIMKKAAIDRYYMFIAKNEGI